MLSKYLTFIGFVFKIINPFKFLQANLEKNFSFYWVQRKLGVNNKKDDFHSCYFNTLYMLLSEQEKDKNIIKLFCIKEVAYAFEEEFYSNNMDSFWTEFEHQLNTNSKVIELKKYDISIAKELNDFRVEFQKSVTRRSKPIEKILESKIDRYNANNYNSIAQLILEKEFVEDLEFPKEQMNSNNPEQALKFFEDYKRRKWDKASKEVKYKILANVGICKLRIGRISESGIDFINALIHKPDDAKAMYLAALGYYFQDNNVKARELVGKAIEIENGLIDAYALMIDLAENELELNQITLSIPLFLKQSPTVALALYRFYKKQNDIEKANKVLESVIDKNDIKDPDIIAVIGISILEGLLSTKSFLEAQYILIHSFGKVQKAIELLSSAISKIKEGDVLKYRWYWYSNRGVAKNLIGDSKGAIEDLFLGHGLNPKDEFTIEHIARAFFFDGQYEKALEYFTRLKENTGGIQTKLAQASCLMFLGKLEDAYSIVVNCKKELENSEDSFEVDSLLIGILLQKNDLEAAQRIVENNISKRPNDISNYVDLALVLEKKNDILGAKGSVLKASDLIKDATNGYFIKQISVMLFKYKEYGKASDLLSRVVNDDVYNSDLQLYIQSLLLGGKLKEALDKVKELKIKHPMEEYFVQAEGFCYESAGNIKDAIRCYESFNSVSPGKPIVLFKLLNLYDREGMKDKIIEVLPLLKSTTTLEFRIRYRIAYIQFKYGMIDDSLELAYNTWRDNYSNGDSHSAFIHYALRLKEIESQLIDKKRVENNLSVHLVGETDEEIRYTLLGYKDVQRDLGEVSIYSEIGKELIHKEPGQEVLIGNTFGNKKFKVRSIEHKIINAQRISFGMLSTNFIDAQGITALRLHKDPEKQDFAILNELLTATSKRDEELILAYQKGLPISSLANLRGQNLIETWGGILNSGLEIRISSNVTKEELLARVKYEKGIGVIIDMISILTIAYLNLLDKSIKCFGKIIVASATEEVLLEEISSLKMVGSEGILMVSRKEGHNSSSRISKDVVDNNLEHCEKLLKWVKQACIILPCNKILEKTTKEKEFQYGLYGKATYETILIAQENDLLFYSDDGVLRSLVNKQFQLQGFSTIYMLNIMLEKNIIDQNEYEKALLMLGEIKYI